MENRGYNPKVYLIGPGPLPLLHHYFAIIVKSYIVHQPHRPSYIAARSVLRLKKVSLSDFETYPQVVRPRRIHFVCSSQRGKIYLCMIGSSYRSPLSYFVHPFRAQRPALNNIVVSEDPLAYLERRTVLLLTSLVASCCPFEVCTCLTVISHVVAPRCRNHGRSRSSLQIWGARWLDKALQAVFRCRWRIQTSKSHRLRCEMRRWDKLWLVGPEALWTARG